MQKLDSIKSEQLTRPFEVLVEEELGRKEGKQILKQEANLGDILSLFLTDNLKSFKFSNGINICGWVQCKYNPAQSMG